ncbi:MAG: molybdopterin-dependent oxidoreductase [Streptosporangiales bacterium]|nr:molybdopterin-dependent oxidoreductase [Streptosporangiales bacterium]
MLAGRGVFLADLAGPGTLHAAFLRSTRPHALIHGVETAAAAELPGVTAVLTAADLGAATVPLLTRPDERFVEAAAFAMRDPRLPCLATGRVRYVGEPIALVLAESRHVAEDALELIEVAYTDLEPVLDPALALGDDAPVLHPHLEDNLAARIACAFGDVAAGHAAAAVTVEETYRMGRHGGVPLECRGVMARPDRRTGRLEVWTSSQIPHQVRTAICAATGWPEDRVRVAVPDVGGGFGTKANVYGEEIAVAIAAERTGREVVWVEDRAEHLVAAAHGRDQVHRARLSVDAEGRILAWEDEFLVDVGAGSLWVAGIVANTAIHLAGPYRIPAFHVRGRAAFTNKTLVAQYRGAGRPEACFALERSLDHAARRLGLSPAKIRRRNLLTGDDLPYPVPLPYRDGVPISYDGADFAACLEDCLRLVPEAEVRRLRAEHPELAIGVGVACYVEATGRGPYESGRVGLTTSGDFAVATGAAAAGQGHETTLAQVAADALGVDVCRVRACGGDTDAVPYGVGTFASRSAVLAGSAVHEAAGRLRARARALAARLLDVPAEKLETEPDGFVLAGTGTRVSWRDLAAELAPGGRLELEPALDEPALFRPPTVTWTMGAHVAVAGVDPETGLVRVLRYGVAHEGGVEINPMIVDGQIKGGVAQGIGGALLEEYTYSDTGQPTSGTFADYLLPGTCEVPAVAVRHRHADTDRNPLNVRGVGESGTIAAYPALAQAVDDALGAGGPGVTATPITPSRVLALAEDVPARDAEAAA